MRRGGYDQVEQPNVTNEDESKWCSLPTFVLWAIKDKLINILDDMRMIAVCRHWWLASKCYPRVVQTFGNGSPCLMQLIRPRARPRGCLPINVRALKKAEMDSVDIISIATKKKYTMRLIPNFYDYDILYSKRGWLLMKQKQSKASKSKSNKDLDVFLMNPLNKGKIQLPSIADPIARGGILVLGSFTIRDGYPHLVALSDDNNVLENPITIKTAFPGDQVWTNHTYYKRDTTREERHDRISQLITIRDNVYCYFKPTGGMLVYNTNTQIWKSTVAAAVQVILNRHVTEFKGYLVEVQIISSLHFSFVRYNDAKTSWENLTAADVEDTFWYIGERYVTSTRGEGLKVYYKGLMELLYYYDLNNGTRELVHLPCRFRFIWVDL